jgi:ATP-dependent exoDNAse (exonuclease V) alpha subunit
MLQTEMEKRGISFKCVAPTNKAARVVNGITIHKFVLSHSSRKIMTDDKFNYLFVDEISMVHEYFYKFFITLGRVRPELKFIVAGDFSQLLPVNDRLECDYKNSPALYELCSGQRLQLSNCRRADDTLFNLTNPNNIHNLRRSDFNKSDDEYYYKSLCFTNKKRKEINTIMMNKFIKMKNDQLNKEKQIIPIILKCKSGDEMGQDVKLIKGMPIIARKTTDKYDIMNNETFSIYDINEKTFKIRVHQSPIEININEFQDLFNVAFCMTIHRAQGQTFNENYSIYEWERLDNRLKYVSLSRATDKKYIHIN